MKVLLLGSGGREHALAWKIAQSPKVEKLFIAPGNAGTSAVGENVAIKATDFPTLKTFALEQNIDMIVVGPEDPLVEGIYDSFTEDATTQHIAIIGPTAKGAQLEGSKEFAKGFMERHNIPTARYKSITADNLEEGLAFLESLEKLGNQLKVAEENQKQFLARMLELKKSGETDSEEYADLSRKSKGLQDIIDKWRPIHLERMEMVKSVQMKKRKRTGKK